MSKSNAFEKLMLKSRESSPSPSVGGRPMHDQWTGFEKIEANGKTVAKCIACAKVYTNTARARLQGHR